MEQLTYLQAIVMGLLQGVTELFPVSSLGHSLLVPAWLGGSWKDLVTQSNTAGHTPYLAFVVALHVATAFALIVIYWRDWVQIALGVVDVIRDRGIQTVRSRVAVLIIVATIPVGLVGLLFEKKLRLIFATPMYAAVFLIINGFLLVGAELIKRRAEVVIARKDVVADDETIESLSFGSGALIGAAQILALLPGISRSGVTISAGLLRGMRHADAAHFAFLLATPVILAAGVLKLPELAGPAGHGIGGQVLVGSLVAFVAAFVSAKFLARFFKTQTLYPFAAYCLAAGVLSVLFL